MYNHVTWPERFDPKKSAIYALNDIDVNAPIDGDETGSSAFHGWVMTPTENGCHVLSEETQQGPFFLEEIGREGPGALYLYHQEWIERFARAAERKPPRRRADFPASNDPA